MKNLTLVVCLLALGLIAGRSPGFANLANTNHATTLTTINASSAGDETQETKTFVGLIGKLDDGRLAFQEKSTNTVYLLDDQEKAKEFAGKNVKITGTLDAATSTIHVKDIQPA
ncbi:MAG: DUF5818 domain-containing protein [Terriglobia bacterium]